MLPSTVLEGQIQDLAQEPYPWPTSSASFWYFIFYSFLGVDSTKGNVGNKLKQGLGLEEQRRVHGMWEKMEETESKDSNPQLPAPVILEKQAAMPC